MEEFLESNLGMRLAREPGAGSGKKGSGEQGLL
jgi:hypothetical protein